MKHLLIPCLLTVHCLAQERYVTPVDESHKDPSFLTFRNKLINTVKKRDLPGLMSVTDSEFSGSFGPEYNVGFFKKKLESPSRIRISGKNCCSFLRTADHSNRTTRRHFARRICLGASRTMWIPSNSRPSSEAMSTCAPSPGSRPRSRPDFPITSFKWIMNTRFPFRLIRKNIPG